MNEQQRLFLVQSRSDFYVFERLKGDAELPRCHALHYLQMATELLGKARHWRHGPNPTTHQAFVGFLRSLSKNRRVQDQLGYNRQNDRWESLIKASIPFAELIQNLAPSLCGDGPNPEYPWPVAEPKVAPIEHTFKLWEELTETAGRRFLNLVSRLLEIAEGFL